MSKLDNVKSELKDLKKNLRRLRLTLETEHPNHCSSCNGEGGKFTYVPSTYEDPADGGWEECPSCLARGLNPLDTTTEIDEEEWANNAFNGDFPPTIALILDTESKIRETEDYICYLEEI